MHKFEVIFHTNIRNKTDSTGKMIYRNYEGDSLDSILETIQTELDDSNWIMDNNGRRYRTLCVTDFTIHDLGLLESKTNG